MDDLDILHRIQTLVDEEHALERPGTAELSDAELARLNQIEVALDQCWDLLRQRRARRDAGLDPDEATARPDSVVEGYEQ